MSVEESCEMERPPVRPAPLKKLQDYSTTPELACSLVAGATPERRKFCIATRMISLLMDVQMYNEKCIHSQMKIEIWQSDTNCISVQVIWNIFQLMNLWRTYGLMAALDSSTFLSKNPFPPKNLLKIKSFAELHCSQFLRLRGYCMLAPTRLQEVLAPGDWTGYGIREIRDTTKIIKVCAIFFQRKVAPPKSWQHGQHGSMLG